MSILACWDDGSYANLPLSSFGGDSCSMMDEAPPPPYSDERNTRFKLIPRVIGGPWVVRKAVGTTPVLLGTKINHRLGIERISQLTNQGENKVLFVFYSTKSIGYQVPVNSEEKVYQVYFIPALRQQTFPNHFAPSCYGERLGE